MPLLLKLPGLARRRDAGGGARRVDRHRAHGHGPPEARGRAREGNVPPGRAAGGGTGIYSETYYPRIHLGWSPLRSLVDARHHYIDGPKPELYEIVRDPREKDRHRPRPTPASRDRMKKELERYPAEFTNPSRVDPDLAERLKALGYLSETAPDERRRGAAEPERPDPACTKS